MENNEKNFVDGLFAKRNDNAPDFVLANLSFNEKFIGWLQNNFNSNGYCNVSIKRATSGKVYAQIDTWKPKEEQYEFKEEEIDTSNIPF